MIKQSESLFAIYGTTDILQILCKNTCVCRKTRVLMNASFDLEGSLVEEPHNYLSVFIGPTFQNKIETCLKRDGHGGKKTFAEDMS